jgi:hypothetical protein
VEAKRIHPDLELAYEQPGTKEELLQLLRRIRDEVRTEELYPMIHFECHGCRDGLGVANGQLVTWSELREILIEINHSCMLNLVVVLAACNGAHLIKVASKLDRAPFWAIIGPAEEITAGDAERILVLFTRSSSKHSMGMLL